MQNSNLDQEIKTIELSFYHPKYEDILLPFG